MAKLIRRAEDRLPAVKYIPTDYHQKYGWSGNKPALCFEDGRCVLIEDDEIRTVTRPLDVIEQSRFCAWTGPPAQRYPLNRFVAFCYGSGRKITAEARMLMRKVMKKFPEWKEPKIVVSDEPRKSVAGPATSKADLKAIAAEFKLDPPKLRRILRQAGMRAPYDNEEQVRLALTAHKRKRP